MTERSNMLRAALRAADRGGEMSDPKILLAAFPHSQSTMRAVLLESESAEVIHCDTPALPAATPPAKRARRLAPRAAVVALAIAAGWAVYLSSRPLVPRSWFASSAGQPRAQSYLVALPAGASPTPTAPQNPPSLATTPSAAADAAPDGPQPTTDSRDRAPESPPIGKGSKGASYAKTAGTPAAPRPAAKKHDKSRRQDAPDSSGRVSPTVSDSAPGHELDLFHQRE
jgi:hypothetical protein